MTTSEVDPQLPLIFSLSGECRAGATHANIVWGCDPFAIKGDSRLGKTAGAAPSPSATVEQPLSCLDCGSSSAGRPLE